MRRHLSKLMTTTIELDTQMYLFIITAGQNRGSLNKLLLKELNQMRLIQDKCESRGFKLCAFQDTGGMKISNRKYSVTVTTSLMTIE